MKNNLIFKFFKNNSKNRKSCLLAAHLFMYLANITKNTKTITILTISRCQNKCLKNR